tara:strand:- start:5877 stop:6101 length:225 start_codon:yes stop_codon:yes gene_type:complete
MVKHEVFVNAALREVKENGPQTIRDIIVNAKTVHGVRFTKAPSPSGLANLLWRDARFVKIELRKITLWKARDEK